VSQVAKLHVAGWTWAVFRREVYDFYSVSPECILNTPSYIGLWCPFILVRTPYFGIFYTDSLTGLSKSFQNVTSVILNFMLG
jgi:hypothetical protein